MNLYNYITPFFLTNPIVLSGKNGRWGGVDYYSDTIYLNPTIPLKSRWVHIINKKYVPSVKLSLEKVNSIFLLFFMKQLILKCTTTPHPFQKNGLIFM